MSEVKRGVYRYRTEGQDNWRTKPTGGLYQHHSRFSSVWGEEGRGMGPIRAALFLGALALVALAMIVMLSHG